MDNLKINGIPWNAMVMMFKKMLLDCNQETLISVN